jgi:hypothetical protein
MIRTLKATGLALIAVLALGAASASAAEFHSSTASGTIDASQVGNNVFTTAGGTVECEGVNFSGTYSAATTKSQTVTPTYSECRAFGFATAHVEVTGCTMTLNADTSSSLNCGATGHIVITPTFFGSVCTVTIGGNQNFAVKSVEFTNTKTTHPWDVDVDQHISGVTYVVSGGGGSCGSVGHHTDGKLEGTVTSRCTQPAKTYVDCWWE